MISTPFRFAKGQASPPPSGPVAAIYSRFPLDLPHPAGLPRFLDRSFPTRCPQPPRGFGQVLAHFFPARVSLHPSRRTGQSLRLNEAESSLFAPLELRLPSVASSFRLRLTPILRDRPPLGRPKSLAGTACGSPLSIGATTWIIPQLQAGRNTTRRSEAEPC